MSQSASSANSPASGTVFLIGAGPGDPGLITVKGLTAIRTADVIVYDYLAAPELLREARSDAETIYVGKKGAVHTLEQEDINALIIEKATAGKTVARLKGGDPYLFGRGGEEAEELVKAGVPYEVIPGVTSAVAAPAYAGIPVTHRDHASTVTFITGHENPDKAETSIDWEVLAGNPGTLVFLMGVKNLPHISASLIERGKDPRTPAALVRWGTTPRQESLVSTLEAIPEDAKQREFKPPAVLVVGGVASLADRLAWFERKPLFGKRILITRSRAQSTRMAEAIAHGGGEPILFPTIAINPVEDTGPIDRSIAGIGEFDWLIFTSVNGVERFFERFYQIRDDIRDLAGPRIGAIGPVTAAAIRDRGLKVDLLAKEFKAEGLLAQFAPDDVRGKRFLIPRAEKAREILPEGIAEMGGEVTVVPVYTTGAPENNETGAIRTMLRDRRIHAITFTSSSTVDHFVEIMGSDAERLLDNVAVASIGPITSKTVRSHGLHVSVEATHYTIDGLLEALSEYYRGEQGGSPSGSPAQSPPYKKTPRISGW